MHNIHYLLALMRRIRAAIMEDRYSAFLRDYFARLYSGDMTKVPTWAVTALKGVGVDLLAEVAVDDDDDDDDAKEVEEGMKGMDVQ